MKWYETQREFHFQDDLLKYCKSDVDILQRCCGHFRSNYLKVSGGVEPYIRSITIASTCNRTYRTNFLKEKEIAIIPPNGYHTDNQSAIACCWLDWVARRDGLTMQHAFTTGEVTIAGMKVDGIDNHGNLYEFQGEHQHISLHMSFFFTNISCFVSLPTGCLWHGCLECYPNRTTENPVNGVSMEDLYQKTCHKVESLRSLGYNVIEMWECHFRKMIEEEADLKEFYKQYSPYEPIHPREPFFGGRVNATRLYAESGGGQEIRYVDFTRFVLL